MLAKGRFANGHNYAENEVKFEIFTNSNSLAIGDKNRVHFHQKPVKGSGQKASLLVRRLFEFKKRILNQYDKTIYRNVDSPRNWS